MWLIFPLWIFFGTSLVPEQLPSWSTLAYQVAISQQIVEAGFYWTHRLLHTKLLYKRFHKQHHEYKGTIGFAAEHAHPVEALLSNQLPTVLGPLLMGMHLHAWVCFLAWRLWRTYETHSGYSSVGSWPSSLGVRTQDRSPSPRPPCVYKTANHRRATHLPVSNLLMGRCMHSAVSWSRGCIPRLSPFAQLGELWRPGEWALGSSVWHTGAIPQVLRAATGRILRS